MKKERIRLKSIYEHPKPFHYIWFLLIAYIFLIGIVLQENTLFHFENRPLGYCTLSALVTGIFAFSIGGRKNTSYWDILVLALSCGSVVFLFQVSLLDGLLAGINAYIRAWNTFYHSGIPYFDIGEVSENTKTVSYYVKNCIVLCGMIYGGKKNNILLFFAMPFLSTILILLVGNVSGAGAILSLIGVIAVIFLYNTLHMDKRKLIWLAALSFVLLSFSRNGTRLGLMGPFKAYLAQVKDTLLYGEDTLPKGDLSLAGKMHADSDVARLTVETEEDKNLYLKGFVGKNYENGMWEEVRGSDFSNGDSGLLRWLKKQDFSPNNQYASYVSLLEREVNQNNVTIENENAYRKYLYTPYGVSSIDDVPYYNAYDTGYLAYPSFQSSEYTYTESSSELPSELLHVEAVVTSPEADAENKYAESESVYREYVYRTYTEIPENMQGIMNALFHHEDEEDDKGIYAVTAGIRHTFDQKFAYEETQEENTEVDPLIHFLTKTRKGNDALFASASVFAYRSYGIPARYVEGYYRAQGSSSSLTSANAHAWVEVYMDGLGWVNVDTTPGYYYDTNTMIQLLEASEKVIETGTNEDEENSADYVFDDEKIQPRVKVMDIIHNTRMVIYGLLVFLLAIVCAAFALVSVLCGIFLLSYKYGLKHKKGSELVKHIQKGIHDILTGLGIEYRIGWKVEQTENEIRFIIPIVQENEYVRVNAILERLYYGEMELEPYEINTLQEFLEKLKIGISTMEWRKQFLFYLKNMRNILTIHQQGGQA